MQGCVIVREKPWKQCVFSLKSTCCFHALFDISYYTFHCMMLRDRLDSFQEVVLQDHGFSVVLWKSTCGSVLTVLEPFFQRAVSFGLLFALKKSGWVCLVQTYSFWKRLNISGWVGIQSEVV